MNTIYSSNKPPKLLYLPNERYEGEHFGLRSVFEGMFKLGELSGYVVFPFLVEQERLGSNEKVIKEIYQLAENFQPEIILWQRPGNFHIDPGFGKRLKEIRSHPVIVYDERDVWGGRSKPFTDSMKTLAKEADIVFLVGLGKYADVFRKFGAKRILYSPHSIDTLRFGHPWVPTNERQFDVVMISNLFRSKNLRPGIPGWKNRWQLAERLNKLLGDRFALFGKGWERAPYARGELPFLKQEEVCRQSWLSVGWKHFDKTPYYFSSRLAIAMMSGVAHVTNYMPGYEIMFQNGQDLCYARTVDEMVDIVIHLLSLPRSNIIEMGLKGQEYAKANLASEVVFRNIIQKSTEIYWAERNKENLSNL